MSDDLPRTAALDCTISLLREGYPYIGEQCRHFHSDIVRTRLLGEATLLMTGAEAARLFYDEARFRRADAVPAPIKKTLFGEGGVQGLDDDAHRNRKAMFMSLMTRDDIARFLALSQSEWNAAGERLQSRERIVLDDEAQEVFARAACAWAGVPTSEEEVRAVARDCGQLFTSFTSLGPRMWRARLARKRVERWAGGIIERIRASQLEVPKGTAAHVIAHHRQLDGGLLPLDVAAVELINIIRPITAIGRWVAWLGLALHDHPQHSQRVRSDDAFADAFVQEVRRYYPFTPLLGARVRQPFTWHGARFEEGQLVFLDVYGTLRDGRLWERPNAFDPTRFLGRKLGPYDFMPHGGGDFSTGHRCAGEWLTIEAMKQALRFLTTQVVYQIPAQDLSYPLHQVPARPQSGVLLRELRLLTTGQPPIEPSQIRGGDGMSASA